MKALKYIFLLIALTGMVSGHAGAGLLALVWVGACMYGEYAMRPIRLGCSGGEGYAPTPGWVYTEGTAKGCTVLHTVTTCAAQATSIGACLE